MPDRLDAMAVVVAVADDGNLSAAARRLRTPLATVSRKVAELENHLGARLFHRSSRGLTLTDTGAAYVEACRRILEDVAEAEQAASGEFKSARGRLVVTAPVVFGRLHLLPVVADFLATYPDIDIRLVLLDRIVNLLEEHVDVAVRIGDLPDSALHARRVGSIRRVLCASPAYLALRGTPQRPKDLGAHDCITFDNLAAPTGWTFGAGRRELTVPVRSRLTVNTAEAAIDAAIAGLGVTRVLSYQIARPVEAGRLSTVLEAFEPPPWPVSLVFHPPGPMPRKLRAFLDFAAPRLAAGLARTPHESGPTITARQV